MLRWSRNNWKQEPNGEIKVHFEESFCSLLLGGNNTSSWCHLF